MVHSSSKSSETRQNYRGLLPKNGPVGLLHLVCPLIAASLVLPYIILQNGGVDWGNHLWLVDQQAHAISALGRPTYFVHIPDHLFSPNYLFYGGTLYSLVGLLAILTGSSWTAFVLSIFFAGAMSYGGTYWLARQLDISPAGAHLLSLVPLTAPFTLTIMNGPWPTLVATCAIPLIFAASLSILRSSQLRPTSVVLLFIAGVAFTGSHNITLLWGSIFIAITATVLLVVYRGYYSFWRLASVAFIGATAIGVNAWFLVPDILYSSSTFAYLEGLKYVNLNFADQRPGVIYRPYPYIPFAGAPGGYFQAPVLPLLWAFGVIAFAVTTLRIRTRRLYPVLKWLLLSLVIFTILTVRESLWPALPKIFWSTQFPIRLVSYIVLITTALVLLGLVLTRGRYSYRKWVLVLAVAVAVQSGFAVDQVWKLPVLYQLKDVKLGSDTLPPRYDLWKGNPLFSFTGTPQIDGPLVKVNGHHVDSKDEAILKVSIPSRTSWIRVATNISYSPLIKLDGARIAGRDPNGNAVIDVTGDGQRVLGKRIVKVGAASPTSVTTGIVLTFISVFAFLAFLAGVIARRRKALQQD